MKITAKGEYYQISGISYQEILQLRTAIGSRNGSLETVGKEPELVDLYEQLYQIEDAVNSAMRPDL